jgi:hypothetical protein
MLPSAAPEKPPFACAGQAPPCATACTWRVPVSVTSSVQSARQATSSMPALKFLFASVDTSPARMHASLALALLEGNHNS